MVGEGLEKGLTGKAAEETVPVLGEDKERVLVKVVADEVGVAAVSFSAVDEEKRFEETELPDGEICTTGCLRAF